MNLARRAAARGTREVFEDHIRLRLEDRLDEDLARNYAPDVVLLTVNSNGRGHDAIRVSARRLSDQLPGARFEIVIKQGSERFALLIWRHLRSSIKPSTEAMLS